MKAFITESRCPLALIDHSGTQAQDIDADTLVIFDGLEQQLIGGSLHPEGVIGRDVRLTEDACVVAVFCQQCNVFNCGFVGVDAVHTGVGQLQSVFLGKGDGLSFCESAGGSAGDKNVLPQHGAQPLYRGDHPGCGNQMADRLGLIHGSCPAESHLQSHGRVIGLKDAAAAFVGSVGDPHIGGHDSPEHQGRALLLQN